MCNATQKRLKQIAINHKIPCAYCGGELNTNNVTIDHIRAKFRGGENILQNYLVVCKSCNTSKNSTIFKKFINRIDICNIVNNIIMMSEYIARREYCYKLFGNNDIPDDFKRILEEAIN